MASSVNLGSNLESVVDRLVSEGRFGSRSEVLREGVRLVQEREANLRAIEQAIAEGDADIKAGRVVDADAVFDRLIAKYQQAAAER